MKTRTVGLAVALAAASVTSGCGLTGTPPNELPAQSGRVTIGGIARNTQSVECTQVDWGLAIEASTDPGRAYAFLELGGAMPLVRTVSIENIDGVHGVAGGDVGKAAASIDGNMYTITGTAVGASQADRGQTQTMPFEIKAPC